MHDWLQRHALASLGDPDAERAPGVAPGKRTLTMSLAPRPAPSGGRAMDESIRGEMERSFGADLGSVRVHEGQHVTDLGAEAYAQGESLHFAPGRYRPDTESGRELLGHELTHVIQQRSGRVAAPQFKGGIVRDAALEREADEVGARVARGQPAGIAAAGGAASAQGPIQGHFVAESAEAKAVLAVLRAHATRGDVIEFITASESFHVTITVQQLPQNLRGASGVTVANVFAGEDQVAVLNSGDSKLSEDAISRADSMMVSLLVATESEVPVLGLVDSRPVNQLLAQVHEFERHVVPFHELFMRMKAAQAGGQEPKKGAEGKESKNEMGAEGESPAELAAAFAGGEFKASAQHDNVNLAARTAVAALRAAATRGAAALTEMYMRLYDDTVGRGVDLDEMTAAYAQAGGDAEAAPWLGFVALATRLVGAGRGAPEMEANPGDPIIVAEGFACGRAGVVERMVSQEDRDAEAADPDANVWVFLEPDHRRMNFPTTWLYFPDE